MNRAGGILLHPTSLPSAYGIGDLGSSMEAWLEWLRQAGCGLWQFLPLGPTGVGNSPYQSYSAFAGNELLISPQTLVEEGLLSTRNVSNLPPLPDDRVDFTRVRKMKYALLEKAAAAFLDHIPPQSEESFDNFVQSQSYWLDDYSLFMALDRHHAGRVWTDWPPDLRGREKAALQDARKELTVEIRQVKVLQFLFHQQWMKRKRTAQQKGITLIGDLPIFVAFHSADVWANQSLFHLDESGRPTLVAGVPPDYFSETGQLWGNPLYRWDVMQSQNFAWWMRRLRRLLEWVDVIRLDHFRGFESYWEIPAQAKTAQEGRWAPGPGDRFFERVASELGQLPFIAEDLGTITPEVTALRQRYELPGMKVLQFGFEGGPANLYMPHNYNEPCAVYTGTHDNDTSLGWYETAAESTRDYLRRYLSVDGSHVSWDLIRAAWASTAEWAIAPFQDVLSLGSEARMNRPSTIDGNWEWRFSWEQVNPGLQDGLQEMGWLYDRQAT
jgi:4-alpha-glucanotransferase